MKWNLARFVSLAGALWLLSNLAFGSSPFYFTFERSFAPEESVELRVDYSIARTPLRIRVLRPENVDRFLDGQYVISRSYEQPRSALNPGHYFSRGINRLNHPFEALRRLFSASVRDASGIGEPLRAPNYKRSVYVPPAIDIAPPAGFKIAKELFVDVQRGGSKKRDVVPGFEDWWGGYIAPDDNDSYSDYYGGSYSQRNLNLGQLPAGIYLVQGIQGANEGQAILQVSPMSLQVKQSNQQLQVRAIDRKGLPVSGVKIAFRDQEGRWQEVKETTNGAGEVLVNADKALDAQLVIKATHPDGTMALSDTEFLGNRETIEDMFLFTDRPIFKPGDTFSFKGIFRNRTGKVLLAPKDKSQVEMQMVSNSGSVVGEARHGALNSYGSVSGSFAIPETVNPGVFQVRSSVKIGRDYQTYIGELRVRDYVKPSFYIESAEESGQIRPGSEYKVKLKAVRYSGGVPKEAKYDYFVYRKKYSVPEFVEDAGMGIQTGNDYFGGVQSAKPLSQPERIYSSVDERQKSSGNAGEDPWLTAPTFDKDGMAQVSFTLPNDPEATKEEWVYVLSVRARDEQGSSANFTKESIATKSAAVGRLMVANPIMETNGKNLFLVMTFYPDGRPFGNVKGTVAIEGGKEWDFTTDADGKAKIDVQESMKPGRYKVALKLTAANDKKLDPVFTGESENLLVAGTAGEAIGAQDEFSAVPLKGQLNPGEKTKLLVLLPDNWGQNNKGSLWVTLAGSRIFETKHVIASGRSVWVEVTGNPEYGTAFYALVSIPLAGGKYLEQTIPFRIIPDDKILSVSIKPSAPVATPMVDFPLTVHVVDAKGAPVPNAELAVSVVDRAVYAVQQEFRPKILDFFYPVTRLNVMTFYSDQLQGLGYAEMIKKPNFKLGAMKLNSLLKKITERDTAGWFPHLVTDASGHATVTVNMPSNLTEWQVTAVVIDETGRVGEGKGRFRTTRDLFAEPNLPKFLRSGDMIKAPVRLAQSMAQEKTVNLETTAKNGLVLTSASEQETKIPGGGETTVALGLRAESAVDQEANLGVILTDAVAKTKLRPEIYALPIKPSLFSEKVLLSQVSEPGYLQTMVPEAATVKRVQVVAAEGLFGALIDKVEYLIRYPYGCTEQLIHSTMPNIVFLDLIRQLGMDPATADAKTLESFFGPLANQVVEAKKNALAGLARLSSNRTPDGGFGMWPGSKESSLYPSLLASEVFEYAVKVGLLGYNDASLSGIRSYISQNLTKATIDKPSHDADLMMLASYYEQHYGAPPAPILSYVKSVVESNSPSFFDLLMTARFTRQMYDTAFKQAIGKERKPTLDIVFAKLKEHIHASTLDTSVMLKNDGWTDMGFRVAPGVLLAMAVQTLDANNQLDDATAQKLKASLIKVVGSTDSYATYNLGQILARSRALLIKELKRKAPASGVKLADATGKILGTMSPFPGGFIGDFVLPVGMTGDQLAELKVDANAKDTKLFGQFEFVTPHEKVTEVSTGIKVTREFFRVTKGVAEALDDAALQQLNPGDIIVSRVIAETTDASRRNSHYVVVSDAIPSIGEAIDDDRTYLADGKFNASEDNYWSRLRDTYRRPDRTERVFETKGAGTQVSLQVWRVRFEGEASVPPARAFDMYRESLQGHTKGIRVKTKTL